MSRLRDKADDYDHQRRLAKRKFEPYVMDDDYLMLPSLAVCEEELGVSSSGKRRVTEPSVASQSRVSEGKGLFLFVRNMSGKSVVFAVNRDDTVLALHERIERFTFMPRQFQRLIYGGRQLDMGKCLKDYGIGKDSMLHLVGRLPSVTNQETWQLVDSMVVSAIESCRGENEKKVEDIRVLMNKFLTKVKVDKGALGMGHLKNFTSLPAVDALCMMYLSPNERVKQVGNDSIRQFLISTHGFHESLHTYAATIVMGFCKYFDKMEPKDSLYYSCRRTLGSLVSGAAVVKKLVDISEPSLSLPDIYPFLHEAGCSLSEDFADGAEVSDWVILSHVRDFSSFVKPALACIMESVNEEGPSKMPLTIDEMQRHSLRKEIFFLHSMLLNLRGVLSKFFRRVERSLKDAGECKLKDVGIQYLLLLKELNTLSNIYCGEADTFKNMLRENTVPLHELIMRCTKRNEDNNWLLEHKEVLDFNCRRQLAMMMFQEVKEDYDEVYEMLIDRSQLLAESFTYISNAEPETLRAGLFMEFKNEEATGPGVVREWFSLVCKEIFNPQNALFKTNPNDLTRFYINPVSKLDPKHLDYFRVCGRVVALALMHKVQIGIVFDRVFFRQLAGYDVQLDDIKDTDPILYRSCKHILEMDADLIDSDALGLTFVREYEELGSMKRAELLFGGEDIKLNSRNRAVYVKALIRSHFLTATCQQVDHFAQGFGDILSDSEIQSFFRSLELEDLDCMLRGSKSDLSIEDWKGHTEYIGYLDTDPQIGWFWKIVEEMSEGQRRQLLFFWTSVRYLPVEGFCGLATSELLSPLYIHKSNTSTDHLPTSHTCFHQLCIPEYPTLEIMKDRLNLITQDHIGSSFGSS